MNSEKIINALGGVAALSNKLGISRPTVQAWKKRGIPPKWQLRHSRLFAKGRRLAENECYSNGESKLRE